MANEDKYLPPIHPGEILDTEFMQPLKLSQRKLAKELHVSSRLVGEIIRGKRPVTADFAMRLSRFFGTSAELWLGLQSDYEKDCIIYTERTQGKHVFDFIKKIKPVAAMF